ncbi:CoA transferase subunit A [Cytobacillus firmus]|uniref:Acyl-CoA:acetate CoA-transferase, alpha subunit n=1 Tax=Cytobacillus firmus TaxID=1399 RepID=A0A800NGQ0_CYTFI|nr:CoA transferase subunit A [Cytobacillus firmus]KAF0826105.1 Acyl-CoA:acetate CoA-transferase, alpha subunit [Cytobacillus firmus]MBG9549834.1 CoA-transferase [Cytobacillus firmus]MBG9604784.1 CoA-transferase [Cytobacillus firmus]MDD9311332.1 CoA transferase subunit A [Cytobacillus firmus]MED1938860.1 CoA transferase subunit A [Cytobacillus firmus]
MENTFNKIIELDDAMKHFRDGMIIMFGGFGGIGTPPSLIDGILDNGFKDLTLIGNDSGFPHIGIGKVVSQGRAKKMIASHIGSNPVAGQLMTDGKMEVEFSPQGILAERIRAGGVGIPAILSDIGLDNDIVTGNKQTCSVGGKKYLVETALTADISIVFAKKADPYGNLIFDKSARNTNPLVAMAGDMTIAEVEEIVPLGSLDPDEIITPGVFVNYIVPSKGVNWKWAWE